MRAALWQPNTIDALSALAGAGQLSAEHATRLTDAYLFLRKLETILRRQENLGVSRLPSDDAAQSKLAIRAGLRTREKLLAAVQAARGTISELAAL
jgi:glutamine synthetase adenylyltransferase